MNELAEDGDEIVAIRVLELDEDGMFLFPSVRLGRLFSSHHQATVLAYSNRNGRGDLSIWREQGRKGKQMGDVDMDLGLIRGGQRVGSIKEQIGAPEAGGLRQLEGRISGQGQ